MLIGDLVTRISHNHDTKFCIIGISVGRNGEILAILKAIYNDSYIADAPLEDLVNVLPEGKL